MKRCDDTKFINDKISVSVHGDYVFTSWRFQTGQDIISINREKDLGQVFKQADIINNAILELQELGK